jgi:zinc protease
MWMPRFLRLAPHDPLVPAVELLLEALAGGEDAPLTHALTSGADPAALSVSLGVARRAGHWTTVEFRAVVPEGKRYAVIVDALGRGLRSLGRGSIARSRLDLVRASARADEILDADRIHYFVMLHSEALLEAPPGYLSRVAQRFDNVSEENLDAAASVLAERLSELRVTVSGPKIRTGERHWAAPSGRIGSEPARRIVTDTLPDGTQVVLARNNDSQVFALHVALRPRSASEPPGKEGIAAVLHRMFTRGTLVADAASLSARLDLLGARLKAYDDPSIPFDDYYTTPEFSYLRLELPADGWREGVMLLGELLRFPRLEPEELESAKKAILDVQTRRAEASSSRALDAMNRLLAPGSPLAHPVLGTPESIASITLDDLRAFHHQYVTGRHLIVTGVSPVEPGVVLEAVRAALKELPAGNEPRQVPKVPLTPSTPPSQRSKNLREQISIAMAYVFDAPAGDESALAVAGAMLSDALEFQLREKRGLAYSIGASVGRWGGRMRFLVRMGTRRPNLDEALEGLRRGIADFRPSSEDAVSRAANALRGRLLMRRLTAVNQAYFLALERMDGEQPGDALRRVEALRAVDLGAVSKVVKTYFDVNRCAVVVE